MPAAAENTAKPGGGSAARRAAAWLHLAAAPAFALMGLAALLDPGATAMTCQGDTSGWPLGGMAPMYLLMSAFHLGPWLETLSGRRGRG